jgi:hypothetical protein
VTVGQEFQEFRGLRAAEFERPDQRFHPSAVRKMYFARMNATGQVIPLPEFWRAVARGEFDYILKATGQSYS